MRRSLAILLALVLVASAIPAAANHPGSARPRDVQALQDDLVELDATLEMVPADHPRYREFQDRAAALNNDVVRLRDQMRRHRRNPRAEGVGASLDEVDAVRRSVARLNEDAMNAASLRSSATADLPAGTELHVRLDQRVSSADARREDRVEATVSQSVRLSNSIVVPAGSRVRGVVLDVEKAERPQRGGRLSLAFDTLILPDGTRVDMRSHVVSLSEGIDKSTTGRRAGLGAVLGGVLGAVLDGKQGALIGVLVGATGGVAASRGEDVVLPEGTLLTLRVDEPARLRRAS